MDVVGLLIEGPQTIQKQQDVTFGKMAHPGGRDCVCTCVVMHVTNTRAYANTHFMAVSATSLVGGAPGAK